MFENVCFSCFRESSAKFCPYCGHEKGTNLKKFPLALPEGSVLGGRYIVGRVIGQGGFGITYVAKDYKTDSLVAIKEFFPDSIVTRTNRISVTSISEDRGADFAYGKKSFIKEANNLSKFIGQKNIVQVYSYFEENNTAYLAMEYLEGESMLALLKRCRTLRWNQLKPLIFPIMDALSVVHGEGMIHRDISPDNIFICKDGTPKLIDFGAARYSVGDRSQTLTAVLKQGYAPKEQYFSRSRQGTFTDVYALAATMYRALTGVVPPISIERADGEELVPPIGLVPILPQYVNDCILKALSLNAEDRFQTVDEFRDALNFDEELERIRKLNYHKKVNRDTPPKKTDTKPDDGHPRNVKTDTAHKCPFCGTRVGTSNADCPQCGARLKRVEDKAEPKKAEPKKAEPKKVEPKKEEKTKSTNTQGSKGNSARENVTAVFMVILIALCAISGWNCMFGQYHHLFNGFVSLKIIEVNRNSSNLEIPEGFLFIPITEVADGAIDGSVKTVNLSKNTRIFSAKSFKNCIFSGLESVTVDDKNPYFSSEDGVLYNKDKTELILYPIDREDKSFTVPDSVKRISDYAFANSWNLETVNLGSSLSDIGEHAFDNCRTLKKVNCEGKSGVNADGSDNKIGYRAFFGCNHLKSITIPPCVDIIGCEAFGSCFDLEKVKSAGVLVNNSDILSLTRIESRAFEDSYMLKKIKLNADCVIDKTAFYKYTEIVKY